MSNPRRFVPWLFGATIVLSAFLLFQVQPMISKAILAWFGGGAAVWSGAMLFFQAALLGGYGYAHALSRLPLRAQARLHLMVLAVLLLYLLVMAFTRAAPILPGAQLRPGPGGSPALQVLGVLALSVGLPYLLLSTTSSLAQSWYNRLTGSEQPYLFYALSNLASLLGLLTYPLLFEPLWTVTTQARFWSVGFGVYLALSAALAVLALRTSSAPLRTSSAPLRTSSAPSRHNPAPAPRPGEPAPAQQAAPAPTARAVLHWLALATTSSVMLLAVTNQISQDVPAVPFLWVLPLSIYLLTFIIAFSGKLAFPPLPYALLTLMAVWLGLAALALAARLPILHLIFINAVMLFLICLFCHGRLYATRPPARHLTSFYLVMSIGGALGGLIVSLLAPLVFPDYWEYPLGLLTAGALALWALVGAARTRVLKLAGGLGAVSLILLGYFLFQNAWAWFDSSLSMSRSFYGVLRMRRMDYEGVLTYNLVHGRIIHGSQGLGQPYSLRPTRYYSPNTGIGLAFQNHPKRDTGQPLHAAMVGLGAGTVAAYGQPGDQTRFYEIDPRVIALARDPRYFTYLKDTQAQVEIVLGDARLSMERELRDGTAQQYDLLAVDAFTGDSVPTHLLNREALALYLRQLGPDGILAFHISNRHLDLEPVVAALAQEQGLVCYLYQGGGEDWLGTGSIWALLAREETTFRTPALLASRQPCAARPGLRPWTDDYSNLIQVLR